MTALQKLGQELVEQARDRVKRVPMPEDVRDAILACQQITNHEGRRRQMQFVGKKMRTLDEAEVADPENHRQLERSSKAETAAMHAMERRRDKLLTDDNALTELLSEHPHLDVQQLRTDPQCAQRTGRKQTAKSLSRDFPDSEELQKAPAGDEALEDAEGQEDEDMSNTDAPTAHCA
jgi:ribosome-associated protein